jgi:hypothetical protein
MGGRSSVVTTESDADTAQSNRIALIVLGVLIVGVGVILYFALRSPPQMGTSAEVFNTVDALYTAVRNEDEKRLGECELRLRGYREAGKLPPDAAKALDAIITKARSGKWRPAAESLYEFMKGQRREGVIEHSHHDHDKKGKSPKGNSK